MTVQEKTAYQLEAEQSIEVFAKYVLNDCLYDDTLDEIREWEEFIINWLNGTAIGDCEFEMGLLFETFQPYFSVRSTIYRGMQLAEGQELRPKPYASFSLEIEVAKYFAGYSEVYDYSGYAPGGKNYLLTVNSAKALDLSTLLQVLLEKTGNEDMQIAIEERMWETEVIAPLTEEMIQLAEVYTFPKEEEKVRKHNISGMSLVLEHGENGMIVKGGVQ